MHELSFKSGRFRRDEMIAWARAAESAYPNHAGMHDRAPALIINSLTNPLHLDRILCFDREDLVGLLSYHWIDNRSAINVLALAVLPSHQKRGIGTELLERAKRATHGVATVNASWLLETTHRALRQAGFRRVEDQMGLAYRWP